VASPARLYLAAMHPVQRARITRELHDVVAHSISVVTVQAAAADAYLERDPVQAREHLAAVRRTAQDALAELRRLGGVLQSDAATRLPQPTLGRIGELVAEARTANPVGPRRGTPGRGNGIQCMLDRARMYGGTVDAGFEPGGTFAVRARLPI
jgi:signal transduction histidine kinase